MNKFVMKSTVMAALATTLFTGVALADSAPIEFNQILTASDRSENMNFGNPVALSGDYALVGINASREPYNRDVTGKVYIFKKNSAGIWNEQQILTAPDKALANYFGYSMAISGDYALIGAIDDLGNYKYDKKVYVFKKNDYTGIWEQQQILTTSDKKETTFGVRISLSSNYAFIGSNSKVYIFKKNNGMWKEQQVIDKKGCRSISLSENYALVGGTITNKGIEVDVVYIFKKDKDGMWKEQQVIEGKKRCSFGGSISLSENYAFVGGTTIKSKGGVDISFAAVYIFKKNNDGMWEEQRILSGTTMEFGGTVSNSDNSAVIGDKGKAYVFDNTNNEWVQQQKVLTPIDNDELDNGFGSRNVAISGDNIFVGTNVGQGKVYAFHIIN